MYNILIINKLKNMLNLSNNNHPDVTLCEFISNIARYSRGSLSVSYADGREFESLLSHKNRVINKI